MHDGKVSVLLCKSYPWSSNLQNLFFYCKICSLKIHNVLESLCSNGMFCIICLMPMLVVTIGFLFADVGSSLYGSQLLKQAFSNHLK